MIFPHILTSDAETVSNVTQDALEITHCTGIEGYLKPV